MSVEANAASPPHIHRRVILATMVGTTIEWFDFFIFATAAALVFPDLFFKPAGPQIGLLLSFASVGISFLFRPLGAFLAGHYGDRLGRRTLLVITLLLMGGATTLIGVLPTYASAGVAAPVLLVTLRILQGISAGGEWGGAALMAVEHAPPGRRGLAGAFPQIGVPLGMLLASGVIAMMTGWLSPGEQFHDWGWRVPFLLSIAMIVTGYYVRRAVAESPVFVEIARRRQQTGVPIAQLFRRHASSVLLATIGFAANNAAGYMSTGGFIANYASDPDGPVALERTNVLLVLAATSALWIVTTLVGGWLSDRWGRRTVFLVGYVCQALTVFPLFWLMDTGNLGLFLLGLALFMIGLGLTYGPLPAWFAELYPASIRFSGVSITFALGAIFGGAFSPLIATRLVQVTGGTTAVAVYLLVMTVLAIAAIWMLRDRSNIDLGIDNVAEQERGATIFS